MDGVQHQTSTRRGRFRGYRCGRIARLAAHDNRRLVRAAHGGVDAVADRRVQSLSEFRITPNAVYKDVSRLTLCQYLYSAEPA
jgi:hypothetical protein